MEISKENFLKLPEVNGVYTFYKEKTPIYIGKSVNLKSRLNSYLLVNLGIKTRKMVSEADEMKYIEVSSELESLLLESFLIKKYKPKYNIVLKDDKHSLYIEITNDEYPRVITARKNDGQGVLFGPFPNSTNVKSILRLLRKIFPYSDHKIGKKPCLYSHIGLCNPCPNYIISSGILEKELKERYLRNIKNVKLVLSRKFNIVRKSLEKEMLQYARNERYEDASKIRDKIKALDYITQKRINEEKFLENSNLIEDIRLQEINEFRQILFSNNIKPKSLDRIECFDIAHLSGSAATASMVVLLKGEKENSEYRHFKIRQNKSQSDYDSMKEIALRRIKNISRWSKPDLIIVDGGLGQVKIFNKEFEKLGIDVVGIAKHPDRLILANGKKIRLTKLSLQLVSRIRDEAHRFARRYHHKLISKTLLEGLSH